MKSIALDTAGRECELEEFGRFVLIIRKNVKKAVCPVKRRPKI